MADSSSSTSEKPPIEEEGLGFGPLIPDAAPSDPITFNHEDVEIHTSESFKIAPNGNNDSSPKVAVEVMEENDACEESGLRNAIERQVYQLTIEQAEIEAGCDKLEVIGDVEGSDAKIEKRESLDQQKDGLIFEVENENEDGPDGPDEYEGNVDGHLSEVTLVKGGRYTNQIGSRRKVSYPMRPDAEDCGFYMKFGMCKFGSSCKFNHPPRRKNQGVKDRMKNREENTEREGQTECKYYLTSGGCKYGKDCKYFHGSDKIAMSHVPEFNFLGLPIRPGEKECPYYLRTGSCKYGSNCRFHHPDPTTVAGGDSYSGFGNGGSLSSQLVSSSSVSSWSSPRAYNETSPFLPVIYPPPQGVHTPNSEWNGYQAAAAYPISERSLPTPPAFAINNLQAEINFPIQQHDLAVEEYPERPGEPDCNFFLKTGDCKYKSNCKYHHPKNRISKAKSNSYALNDKGLPLRPDQPICTHYHRYGICKYGPACKYDHPSNLGMLPPPFDQPPFGELRNVESAGKFRKEDETGSSMYQSIPRLV